MNELSKKAISGEFLEDLDKLNLFDLLKEKKFRTLFLNLLNKHRSSGLFHLNEKSFEIVGDILNAILDAVNEDLDYDSARYCIILSQTFHKLKEKSEEKIFLQNKIQKHKILKSENFWENFVACIFKYFILNFLKTVYSQK